MNDEDFKTTVLDYFQIESQRYQTIMAALSDVTAELAELKTVIKTKADASTEAMASLEITAGKALSDFSATGAAGHAAVLDTIVAQVKDAIAGVTDLDTTEKLKALEAKLLASITAMPVPGTVAGGAPPQA